VFKNKLLWMILAIVIVASIWVAGVYLPSRTRISYLHRELADLDVKEKEYLPAVKIDALSGVVDSLSRKLNAQNKRIYPESALIELGKAVEKLGKAYQLTLQSISPDFDSLSVLSSSGTDLSELRIIAEFKGTFSHFTRFLDESETFPFAIIIQEVVFEKESASSQELKIKVQGNVVLRKARNDGNAKVT